MSDFIKIIPISGKNYYFTFREISTLEGRKFFVTTLENDDAISFDIRTDKFDNWKIIEPVPKWIKQIEEKLFEVIKNHNENS